MHCHSNIKTLSGCWPSGLGLSWDTCVTYWHADVPSPSPAPDSRIVPMQILGHSKLQAREGGLWPHERLKSEFLAPALARPSDGRKGHRGSEQAKGNSFSIPQIKIIIPIYLPIIHKNARKDLEQCSLKAILVASELKGSGRFSAFLLFHSHQVHM